MRIKFHKMAGALLALGFAAGALAPATLAADVTDIGYVDQGAISSLPAFQAANRQLGSYKATLDKQFAARVRGVKDPNVQARVAQQFQNLFGRRQQALVAPLVQRAQIAIASVASSRNLSVVVDKRIIIVGGQDITKPVMDLITGVGDPVPPVNTPAPSSVGYVDQNAIDAVPAIKSANEDFQKFQNQQQQAAQTKLRSARSEADKEAIVKDMRKTLADKAKQSLDPVVDRTRNTIADVARKRGLVLVIDRSNLIYGGTDITTDVTNALK